MFKRLRKRWTIRERAFQKGCNLRDRLSALGVTARNCSNPKDPEIKRLFRAMVRLHKIVSRCRPFKEKWGWVNEVFISEVALERYGNIVKE